MKKRHVPWFCLIMAMVLNMTGIIFTYVEMYHKTWTPNPLPWITKGASIYVEFNEPDFAPNPIIGILRNIEEITYWSRAQLAFLLGIGLFMGFHILNRKKWPVYTWLWLESVIFWIHIVILIFFI